MERLNGEFRDREKVMRVVKKDDSVIGSNKCFFYNARQILFKSTLDPVHGREKHKFIRIFCNN